MKSLQQFSVSSTSCHSLPHSWNVTRCCISCTSLCTDLMQDYGSLVAEDTWPSWLYGKLSLSTVNAGCFGSQAYFHRHLQRYVVHCLCSAVDALFIFHVYWVIYSLTLCTSWVTNICKQNGINISYVLKYWHSSVMLLHFNSNSSRCEMPC